MIKNLFLFLAVLGMFAALSKAQVSSVTGQYLQDNNLLINPGFESGIGKWTNSAGTFTADYSVFVQGKASGKVVLSSQNMDFYQDSTLFASQLADGMQAILTVKIKSNVAGVRVCPRQAGVVITSLCVSVQGNDKWGLYQIPFVTGATSQGISINSNGSSITGTVYVDESYVGVSNILNSSSEAKLAGEAYFAGTTGCTWARTSTTIGAFSTVAACPGPTIVRQSLGAWQTTDSDLPRITVNNLPAGTYKATYFFTSYQTTSGDNAFAINDGTTTCQATGGESSAAASSGSSVSCTFNYTEAGNKSFNLFAAASVNTVNLYNARTSPNFGTKFILEYYGSNSTYTTTAGINNVDVFSAKVSSAGVVSEENVDWINGNAVVTGTAVYTMTFNTSIFTQAPNCQCTPDYLGGSGARDCMISTLSETTYGVTLTSAGTIATNSFKIMCQKQGADFVASKTITGSFNEVMTTPGIAKPVSYIAYVAGASINTACTSSPCTVHNDAGALISSIARTTTGRYTFTSNNGKFRASSYVRCIVNTVTMSSFRPSIQMTSVLSDANGAVSSGTGEIRVLNASDVLADGDFWIKCEGVSP